MDKVKYSLLRTKNAGFLAFLFVFFSIASAFVGFNAQDTYAASCAPTRYSCNQPERAARDKCVDRIASGAMWFNTSNNDATDSGYYSATVNVTATANTVRVNLRGSVNACLESGNYTAYAVNVRASGAQGGRLTNLSSTTLNRGQIAASNYQWSSQGSSIGATLDVSGLATDNDGKTDTQQITIDIYRCFSTNGSTPTGECYATPVLVTVVRAAGPNYNLVPTITSPNGEVAETGDTISYRPVVNNNATTTSPDAQWQTITFVTTGNPKGAGTGTQAPKDYFGNGASVVDTDSRTFPRGNTSVGAASKTIGNLAVGSRVCYALAVKPYNQNSSNWRYSAPVCFKVGKQPKTQVWGGDLRVGSAFSGTYATSKIDTSVTVRIGKTYGSWGEYALIASGKITGAGSGSAYSNGVSCTSNCATNNLSFANDTSTIGNYRPTTTLPNVAASFPVSAATPNYTAINQTVLNSKQVVTANGAITISGGTVNKGNWLVINAPTRTVSITGDIKYTADSLSSAADIPQVVIIANQINIAGNVKNVDAWLVASGATGTVNTCSDVSTTANLSNTICSNALTINGPVMAKKLFLRRTAGADATNLASAAEIINLRPDAYLWGSNQAALSPRLQTTSTKELPPRF
jgi:hypothetical protein